MKRSRVLRALISAVALVLGAMFVVPGARAAAGDTTLVSIAGATQGNGLSGDGVAVSGNGRFVAFGSGASNLTASDSNGSTEDVLVKDLQTGTIEIASVNTAGNQGTGFSSEPSISRDGRYVMFISNSTDLDATCNNGLIQLFVRDRLSGTTTCVSVTTAGAQLAGSGIDASISHAKMSRDGRFVTFTSAATNLPGAVSGQNNVYLRDLQAGTTELISIGNGGANADSYSYSGEISDGGRYVSFASGAHNLLPTAVSTQHAYVRDRQTGTTEMVDVNGNGDPGDVFSSLHTSIDSSGRYVTFGSFATNLVANDDNGLADEFVRDRQTGTTERVSVASDGTQMGGSNGVSNFDAISGDGRFVSFDVADTDLVANDNNNKNDIFVHDRLTGATTLASVATDGTHANDNSGAPAFDDDGGIVAYDSAASNLVGTDANNNIDVFMHENDTSVPGDHVSQTVTGGTEVSTGSAPSASDQVETSVIPSAGGTVSIDENGSPATTPPANYTLLDQEVVISAPDGTQSAPITLKFRLYYPLLTDAGVDENSVQILRNGVVLSACDPSPPRAAGTVSPEPTCVDARAHIDDYAEITVLTEAASTWDFGVRAAFPFTGFSTPLKPYPALATYTGGTVLPVKFGLGGNQGVKIFAAGYPRSIAISCASLATSGSSTATTGGLSYTSKSQRYTYNWTTLKVWNGTCRQLLVEFIDGHTYKANVKFTK